jgi:hypothetical protein
MKIKIENDDRDDMNDLLKDIEIEKNKKNLRNWLNNKFPKGWGDYSPYYTLFHPWVVFSYWYRNIRWAWQRVFRGWDDRISWSVDYYLAKNLPLWIKQLKEDGHGIPTVMWEDSDFDKNNNYATTPESDKKAEEKWDNILDQIILGFETYQQMQDEVIWENNPKYFEMNKKFENGFDLLKKYFGNLWD